MLPERFGRVLRAPHAPYLAITSLFARLPYSVDALAILLYVRDRTGSFALGGLVSAATAIASAIGMPILGRLVDRAGHTRVLVGTTIGHALGITALVVLGELGAPVGALAATAVLTGLYPPISPCLRGLWPQLLDEDEEAVRTALALDAVLLEMVFIGGPLLAALVFAVASPAAALVVVLALASAGSLAFAASAPSRGWRGTPHEAGWLGPLTSPGLRTLLLAAVPLGAGLGSLDVALPAFGVAHGSSSIGGVAIACLAAGSAVGGFWYGARAPADARRTYLLLVAALPPAIALLAVPSATLALLLVAPVAGALLAPLTAAENELAAAVSPRGTTTEAYSWIITATIAGIAIGNAAAGVIVEAASWREAVLAAAAITVLGAAASVARRATLRAPVRAAV